ncbi:MAG: ORF6N domain-containing protein, partial [Campylobacterota bacterium]|nr:ORF6N domain-containing protein [Campylobacterota bacterium]
NSKVKTTIYTKNLSKQFQLDLEKYNQQYSKIEVKNFASSHDRFLIIDEKYLYHIGASLKDLGKKWFAFSKLDMDAFDILSKLEKGNKV